MVGDQLRRGHSAAMHDVRYGSILFDDGYRSAAIFVEARIESLGAFFTPLVAAFILLTSAVVLVLLPALIEEIKPTTNLDRKGLRPGTPDWAKRLGARHWAAASDGSQPGGRNTPDPRPAPITRQPAVTWRSSSPQFAPESIFAGGGWS